MSLDKILILDTETSGLDPAKDKLLEVGLVLYSIEHRAIIHTASLLVDQPREELDPESEKIHGIPLAMLHLGETESRVDRMIRWAAADADAFVAHNADFDSQWLAPEVASSNPWICTCNDVVWPRAADSRSLTNIALAHGVAVVDAHRALADCMTIARLLTRVAELGHDVRALLEPGLRPKTTVVSLAPFEEKDVVKHNGFRWAPEQRAWWRRLATEDVAKLPFRTRPAAAHEVFR